MLYDISIWWPLREMCAYIIFINVRMSGAKVNNSNFQNARTNAPAITRRCVGSRQIVMVKSRYMRNSLRRMHACLVPRVPTRQIGKTRVWWNWFEEKNGQFGPRDRFLMEKTTLDANMYGKFEGFTRKKNMHFLGTLWIGCLHNSGWPTYIRMYGVK